MSRIQPSYLLRLPPEVLVDIFLEVREEDQSNPWVLQHVNRELRDLVTTSPLLWTIISIAYGPNRVRLHLQRSGQAPLHVLGSIIDHESRVKRINKFVASLLPHGERIRHLHMVFLSDELFKASIPLLISTSAQLIHLEAGVRGYPVMNRYKADVFKGIMTCRPRHLSLHTFPTQLVTSRVLTNVTSFEYRETMYPGHHVALHWQTLSGWLEQMAGLEKLVIEGSRIRFGNPSSADPVPVTLPVIREVKLEDMDWESVGVLWAQLRTPVLEALTVVFFKLWPNNAPGPGVIVSAAQVNPQLQRLDLTNCITIRSRWAEIFHRLPNLTYLRLASCNVDNHTLSALSGVLRFTGERGAASESSHACPKLKHLVFDDLYLMSRVVRDVVVARRGSRLGSQISSIVMRGMDPNLVDDTDILEMMEVVEEFELQFAEGIELGYPDNEGF